MKIIFMGSPDFATPTLDELAKSNHEILAVYSQPPRPAGRGQKLKPTPVHQLAQSHHLSICVPEKLTPEEVDKILAQKPDLIVVVAYGLILPEKLVNSVVCINLHPSALPLWRGAAPMNYPILHGATKTDICIMQMEKGLDTGPVYLRKSYTIGADETAGELHDRFKKTGAELMLEVVNNWSHYHDQAIPQQGETTYAHKFTTAELPTLRPIDFGQPAQEIHNKIRGLSPWPGATAMHNNNEIKVLKSTLTANKDDSLLCIMDELKTQNSENQPQIGQVMHIDGTAVWIQTKTDIIGLQILQRSGKRALPASEFVAGYSLKVGDIFK